MLTIIKASILDPKRDPALPVSHEWSDEENLHDPNAWSALGLRRSTAREGPPAPNSWLSYTAS